jgi:hypothetical protein
MREKPVFIIAAMFALFPTAVLAAQIKLVPSSSLMMDVDTSSNVSATTSGGPISLHSSTCFPISGSGSKHDILKLVGSRDVPGRYTLSLKAQHAGKCEITFSSGGDTATLRVTVEQ